MANRREQPRRAEATAAAARTVLQPVPRPGQIVRVSEYFSLAASQDALDFVDVDVWGDDRLYIDPRALRTLHTPWTDECVSLLQDFFRVVISAIRQGDHDRARQLLGELREPNETHLGLSRGRPAGRGLGPGWAREVCDALIGSEAIRTGLLEDLEETILMIEGISFDRISDMATNVIREPLIRFTQAQAREHGIPMRRVAVGQLWDPQAEDWYSDYAELPMAGPGKLLLVPKVIVRRKLHFRPDEYFQHYVLAFLAVQEISNNTELVYLLRDGTRRVNKKDLVKKYGRSKSLAVDITKEHPEILDRYRRDKSAHPSPSLDHDRLANELPGTATPDWDRLLAAVTEVRPGKKGADDYHRAIEDLLKVLFHPTLAFPQRETRLHGGRKRIDITFTNQGTGGFFGWLSRHYVAPHVMVECKNYSGDPGNPELDQLAGRFSPSRGQVGLLVCRTLKGKDLFIERCRDTASDHRGFVISLDDDDLRQLVALRALDDRDGLFAFLKQRFQRLVM